MRRASEVCRHSLFFVALALAAGCEPETPDRPDAARPRRDAALDAPSEDTSMDAPAPLCPPSPPYGADVGEVLGPFTVYDCDGTPHRLEDLCETDVVWLWEMAEWCAACRHFAVGHYDRILERFERDRGERFAGLGIVTLDRELALPTQEVCRRIRETYGIRSPLYFDPTGRFRDRVGGLSNDVHVILTRGMRVMWHMQFGGSFVEAQIEATFEALDSGAAIPDAAIAFDAGPLDDAR